MKNEKLKEALKICVKHPGSYLKIKNIIYPPKLFFVNSILYRLQKNLDSGLIDDKELDRCVNCVLGYIKEENDLSYENGQLVAV